LNHPEFANPTGGANGYNQDDPSVPYHVRLRLRHA
jgi:hypothetical protein